MRRGLFLLQDFAPWEQPLWLQVWMSSLSLNLYLNLTLAFYNSKLLLSESNLHIIKSLWHKTKTLKAKSAYI